MLTTKVAFGRLHRNVPQEKLDLLQLASRSVAEPSTGPTQVRGSSDAGREAANLATPMIFADSFAICQTAFTVPL